MQNDTVLLGPRRGLDDRNLNTCRLLIQAMLHGKKTLQVHGAEETVNEHRGLRALLLLALAATVVAILVYVAPLPDYEIY